MAKERHHVALRVVGVDPGVWVTEIAVTLRYLRVLVDEAAEPVQPQNAGAQL